MAFLELADDTGDNYTIKLDAIELMVVRYELERDWKGKGDEFEGLLGKILSEVDKRIDEELTRNEVKNTYEAKQKLKLSVRRIIQARKVARDHLVRIIADEILLG